MKSRSLTPTQRLRKSRLDYCRVCRVFEVKISLNSCRLIDRVQAGTMFKTQQLNADSNYVENWARGVALHRRNTHSHSIERRDSHSAMGSVINIRKV